MLHWVTCSDSRWKVEIKIKKASCLLMVSKQEMQGCFLVVVNWVVGEGVLPYIRYIGMCGPGQRVLFWNHFGLKTSMDFTENLGNLKNYYIFWSETGLSEGLEN